MRVELFSYRSVRGTLDENAARFARFIREQGVECAHYRWTQPGRRALRMLANDPDALPGRVVCLGSPLTGSRAADILSDQVWAEEIIGNSVPAV